MVEHSAVNRKVSGSWPDGGAIMKEIIDRVWVGGDEDVPKVSHKENWYLTRACKFGPLSHKNLLGYTTQAAPIGEHQYWVKKKNVFAINLLDLDNSDMVPSDAIILSLKEAYKKYIDGYNLGFFCNAGVSRGPSVAMLFLRSIGEFPSGYLQSEKIMRTLYPKFDPRQGIKQASKEMWSTVKDMNLL